MQIKYRITLVFTVIVTILLLALCTSIYFFSASNLEQQYRDRLKRKAISTANMLKSSDVGPELIKQLNKSSPNALLDKSIVVFDFKYNETFSYNDPGVDTLNISKDIIQTTRAQKTYYFNVGRREAVSYEYRDSEFNYIVVVAAYDTDRDSWLSKLKLILFVCFFISITGVIIGGYIFSLGLVKPISRLTDQINTISSQDLSLRLETKEGKDELNQLTITINNLLARLQLSFDTQRKFIDNASHEMLTPLASISSQIDVSMQRERTNQEYRNVLSSVHEDVQNLSLLVKTLLDIAKVSGSQKGIELVSVRVDELLLQLPSEIKKLNPRYNVRMNFEDLPDDESLLTVFGSEPLLLCAIRNIVHNACKFSSDKTATVELQCEPPNILISVQDKGHGISQDDIENIFQPFYRSKDVNYSIPGSGLGLPLAEHIVRMYGGSIRVTSEQGIGSIFTIILKRQ